MKLISLEINTLIALTKLHNASLKILIYAIDRSQPHLHNIVSLNYKNISRDLNIKSHNTISNAIKQLLSLKLLYKDTYYKIANNILISYAI